MSAGWVCPNCHAKCKTTDTLNIHVKHCRAMSVEEIQESIKECLAKGEHFSEQVAKAIHTRHIAKLRGKKEHKP